MKLQILTVGLNNNLIKIINNENLDLKLTKVDDFVEASYLLINYKYNIVFLKDEVLNISPINFIKISKKANPRSTFVIFTNDLENQQELEYLKKGYDIVLNLSKNNNLLKIYIDKIISYVIDTMDILKVSNDFKIIESTNEAIFNGKVIRFTNSEFYLLNHLVEKGKVISTREELAFAVLGTRRPTIEELRTMDVYVYRVRKKLTNSIIKTIPRKGYRIDGRYI